MKKPLAIAGAILALAGAAAAGEAAAGDATKPGVIDFGARLEAMDKALDSHCETKTTRETAPFMPIHAVQHQIDCEGFAYFGAARKAEFVFGDGALIFVWILTNKSEEADLERAFRDAYGEPTHVSAAFTAFADDHAALRKDIPEALFYSPAIAEQYRAFFDSQTK